MMNEKKNKRLDVGYEEHITKAPIFTLFFISFFFEFIIKGDMGFFGNNY